jgi:hypothetical protein
MEDRAKFFIEKQKEFLSFLKTRYSLYHLSNLFFRDMHYGVMAFSEMNGFPINYATAEELTKRIIAALEETKVLRHIDERSWMLDFPAFKKLPAKPVPAVKSATTARVAVTGSPVQS